MKSIVLYSKRTPSPRHTPVNVSGQAYIYIRAELVANDVSDALDAAKPEKDETVINTIPLE